MTMPPLHHGRPERGSGSRGDGPGPGLRLAWTFTGVLFTCALIGFWTLRLFGVSRGEVGWGTAAAILGIAAVVAALVTRSVRR